MRKVIYPMLLIGAIAWQSQAADSVELKDQKSKVSYAIGLNIGNNFKTQGVDIDYDLMLKGIKDVQAGARPAMTEAEIRTTMTEYQKELRAKMEEKRKIAGEKNKTEGEEFLKANKEKPGVVTLPSGLQYKVMTEGSGESPKPDDTVKVHYRGTLINGEEFDSSYSRNQPAEFAVKGVIKGWTEALQLMKPGGKWQLFIPSALAYGENGGGAKIGPNAVLTFEVELLEVRKVESKPNQQVTSDIIKVPSAEEIKNGAKPEVIKKEDAEKLQKQVK